MKLNYDILWVDDRIKERPFQRIINETKEFLLDQYFNCNIIEAEDFNEFKEKFSAQKEFDIIITDYSLNEGTFGNQVIDFIRDSQHNFTEIFFYSANNNVKEIKLFSNNRITFYQLTGGDYKELENEIIEVINQTIKKFQHIVAMRGMIMNETSSLDVEFHNILKTVISRGETEDILNLIKDKYKKSNLDFNSNIESVKEIDDILLKIGSTHRWRALIRNLPKGDVLNILNEYEKEVIKVRNDFAHAELKTEEGTGIQYFEDKKGGKPFNDEACKIIRKNIIKHKNNLDNLQSELG
ncbi:hypothetical protein AAGV33_01900 [Flavobacterium sp. FBOR7N2.3]|uniref:Response regulatory domain-containing protein n=1 Tax=Flavobacterium magnesitis TaxID=3138077 RepID=A0ABV4TJL3_9FLAO